jgi:putative ABC transport system ATP-binding protein
LINSIYYRNSTNIYKSYLIELKQVTKIYELGGEKIYALHNINLTIKNGEFLAIVGPSGSGKSTLANIIGGLDKPDAGDVVVDGTNIAKTSDTYLSKYRNKKIGFIFQSFNLQPVYTALENVSMPLIFAGITPKKRQERAINCLKAVGLVERMNHKPGQLSGGQRQRVCIARAIANNPEMIIADEPTGNLDSKKGTEIIEMLKLLNSKYGITLFIITHDIQIAKQAHRIITIKDGQISEQ